MEWWRCRGPKTGFVHRDGSHRHAIAHQTPVTREAIEALSQKGSIAARTPMDRARHEAARRNGRQARHRLCVAARRRAAWSPLGDANAPDPRAGLAESRRIGARFGDEVPQVGGGVAAALGRRRVSEVMTPPCRRGGNSTMRLPATRTHMANARRAFGTTTEDAMPAMNGTSSGS